MSATLHNIVDARDLIDAQIAEADGELTDALAFALDAWDTAFTDKAERVALYVVEQLSHAKAIQAEEQRLFDRRKAYEYRADWLKRYLQSALERVGRTKVEGVLCTVALQKNPVSVVPVVPMDEPELRNIATFCPQYVRHEEKWSLDKEAIKADHKAGTLPEDIAKRFAITQSVSLRIR